MMVSDSSAVTGLPGYDQAYSLSEFKELLNQVDLSSKECNRGWVFWGPERYQQSEYEELDNITSPFDFIAWSEIRDKIKHVLEEMTSSTWALRYLVQFWAPEVVDQHLYLTASDQPFGVGLLCKGLCWYRQSCISHRYRVDKGAQEEELGAVGRAYQNKHPESSPDLRLYSTKEFPLRDAAACYGLRNYLALPVFDLLKEECYGVIEVLCFDPKDMDTFYLQQGLAAAQLRTTHLKFNFNFNFNPVLAFRDADSEIIKMLELATTVMPQLQMAQVWVPCHECSNTRSNLSCMERAAFINAGTKIVNSSSICNTYDYHMYAYHRACELHSLRIGKYTNMIAAVMSSNSKSCICRNICDFSISENPLAHYAQKARLSFCFAICLQSLHNNRDFCVVEFFLQFNSREDAFAGFLLPLLLRIMKTELRSFEFAYKGQRGDELVVEVLKENMLSSVELGQSNGLRYESIKYKHLRSKELSMLMVMKSYKKIYPLSDFTRYLQKADLHCLQPSDRRTHGRVFWSQFENEVNTSSSHLPNPIQEKIKRLMSEISKWDWNSYALAQFWAPKMDSDRCYLETCGQPFALGSLYKGLAFFRKQCMEYHYFVDEAAREDERGPPGRVFLNGHPEITPDLLLYSSTEFPLRNQAAHCCLRKYYALPVFEMNQHKCVGVLELVQFSNSSLEDIGKALEAANLSSTHMKFNQSSQGSHQMGNIAGWQLALTEIEEACKLFTEIPQLYMAEVWAPYGKCRGINNNLSCMERVWVTENRWELDLSTCQIQHVEAGKGIAGMALASENKSCFCRNLCGFGIADQPLAHYAQHARLDVCFAICLQSQYTGDLVYVLEFYLNQGPGGYEYLRSFLCLLLPIMKQKLRSFKVASGQKLGEKLVVEVIEFSQVNELAFSELDQTDAFPITFKFVKYGGQKHSKGKTTRKRKSRFNIDLDDLIPYFGQKLKDVAEALGVSKSTIKRICRDNGIEVWPWNENHKKNRSLFMRKSANEGGHDSQQNILLSSCSDLPPTDTPLHQNVAHTNPESSQGPMGQPKVDTVVIKAKYEADTIKFELCRSAGMVELAKEVAMGLNLKMGSFKLKYLDEENDEILLARDADLQLRLKSLAAVGQTCIKVFVQSIGNKLK